MAGWQDHLLEVGRVPGCEDEAAVVGVRPQLMDEFGNLVDTLSSVVRLGVNILGAKVSPLETVDRTKVTLLTVSQAEVVEELAGAISIPDLDASLAKGLG